MYHTMGTPVSHDNDARVYVDILKSKKEQNNE